MLPLIRLAGLLATLGAALIALAGCAAEAPAPRRPDILLVSVDTLRADHTSAYGYARPTTPRLERLAAAGVRFAVAYAPTATTAPSHASLLTGLPPMEHGVERNGIPLPERVVTLQERLRDAGYATAGFVSSFVIERRFGFGQGFESYDDDFRDLAGPDAPDWRWNGALVPRGVFERPADVTTDRALAWIRDQRLAADRPLFVFVHYIDPHEPYEPPDSIGDPLGVAGRPERSLEWLIGRYDTSIRFTDDQLGRLVDGFEATRRADGALVVITADHGEGFLEHGWRSHGAQIYEEAVRVPLLVIWRGVLEGPRLVERPVTLADLPPTVLGLLGGVDASGMRGTDLRAWLEGTAAPEQAQPVFMERQTYERDGLVGPIPLHTLDGLVLGGGVEVAGREFGVRLGRWKYLEAPLETPSRELYDLVEDPLETRNLADLLTGRADRLSALLARWRATAPPPAPAPALSEEERARLGALGYRSPGTAPPAPPGEPPR